MSTVKWINLNKYSNEAKYYKLHNYHFIDSISYADYVAIIKIS